MIERGKHPTGHRRRRRHQHETPPHDKERLSEKKTALVHDDALDQEQHQGGHAYWRAAEDVLDDAQPERCRQGKQVGAVDAPVIDRDQRQHRRYRDVPRYGHRHDVQEHKDKSKQHRRAITRGLFELGPDRTFHLIDPAGPARRVAGSTPGKA